MTISTERRATPIILGTGANADIPFDFKVFRAEDILLVKSDGLNIESTLVLGNDYSVVLNPNQNEDAGGFVKLKVALATGERAIITTNAPSLQETRLINQGGFYPDVLNNAFDYLTILIQQLETQIKRVVLLPITTKIDKEKFTRNLAFLTEHVNELDALFNILSHIVIVSRISKEVVVVSKIEKDVTAVANNNTNVTKVADNEKNINAVQANETNINIVSLNIDCLDSICKNMLALLAVCKNETNITKVANNETNINKVSNNETNITKTATNETNINKLVANETNINTVAGVSTDVTTVATNVADVTNFSDVYLGKRNVKPTTRTDGTALVTGDLYFDTVKKSIFVYDTSLKDWVLISSIINAILKQFYFVAVDGQNVFKGNDNNNKLLEFELDYIEIFLNGVHLNPEDFTLDTTNQSITLKEVASEKDELYVRSFGALALPSQEIKNILTIKQKILDVSAKLKEIEGIEKKLKEIVEVHGAVKEIGGLAKIQIELKLLHDHINELEVLFSALPQIKTIAADLKNIDTVATKLKTKIDIIVKDKEAIDKVALIDGEIKTIFNNLDAILKAAGAVVSATESIAGIAKIATQAETTAGIIDNKIVTPLKLEAVLAALELSIREELSELKKVGDVYAKEIDKNSNRLVTHRTDIQQNTTDIVSNTASIATIIDTLKKGITTDKLAQSFTVPSVLHDKIQLDGEENTGNYGYSVAMGNNYLAIADPINQEVVIYHRNDNNIKLWNLEDVHRSGKHGDIFVEDGQVYAKRKDGVHLDVFEYDETQTNLTFKKVSTINLTGSFGKSLAIDDEYLIVGNPQASTALIYKHSGIQWQLVEKLSGGTSFGSDVAINHKYILVSEVANKKAEVYKILRGFDFSAERVTGRFKVNTDVYLNAPAASTAGFLGYTVADDDGVNFYQLAQNLDDNAVYVRKFDGGNNGVWSNDSAASFSKITNFNILTLPHNIAQRFYTTNQVNSKLMVGFYFFIHNNDVNAYYFLGFLCLEVETNKIYYHCYDASNRGDKEISTVLSLNEFNKMMQITERSTPYHSSIHVEDANVFKATTDSQGRGGSPSSDNNLQITLENAGVKKQFQLTGDDETNIYIKTKTGNNNWSGWSSILGTRPADPIQLEVVPPTAIKHFKTLTGGVSYSKVIDLNAELSAFAEPDNNILKIYKNLAEIASKTVKADCVSVGTGIVLATSKTDKKAYIYDFYSKTGWFTTTRTKWAGIADNANGYTGYNIAGGQYQLVRPVGTTDTYTKYRGRAWVKNGAWGGVLWYLGSKIGFNDARDNQWHLKGKRITSGNNFGRWMGLSADGTTVIGSSYYGSFAEVYEYKNNNWVQKGQKLATGSYGCAISGDGSSIIINRTSNSCGVFIFTNGKWVQKGNSISENYGVFAYDIFMSGDGLTVATSPQSSYHGYVYEFINGSWKQKGNTLNGIMRALSLDGKTVSLSDSNDIMYVYEFINGSWKQKGNTLNGSRSGLSSDGSVIAVSGIAGTNASVYQIKNATWVRKGSAIPNTSTSSTLVKTSSDGETVVFGTISSATVAIYTFIKGNWQKVGNTLTGGGRFAMGISLTSDGSTVAISADTGNYIEVSDFNAKKQLYLETKDGKHYYDKKELKDETNFDRLMETVAPLASTPDLIVQANRNLKLTNDDIQEQPNKTGAYVSLLGAGTATTAKNIDDTNFTIGNNYGDACAITTDKILITNKTDGKLAIYDHLGTKEKDIQLEVGVGSVIDATDTEAVVGSEKANKFEAISLT